MSSLEQRPTALCMFGSALMLCAGNLSAQSFSIEREVIAAGGGRASGGAWQLDGTIAQTAAGKTAGGIYTLDAGFWVPEAPSGPLPDDIYANGFEGTP